jgi:hypothetical protein
MQVKRCTLCKEEKNISDFFRRGSGYQAYCRPCKYSKQQEWRKSSAGQQAKAKRSKAKKHIAEHYQQRYGITLEEYSILVALSGGRCAICKTVPKTKLFIDHCHTTNKIRGLLCRPCNLVLGFAKDNVNVLEESIKYLVSSNNL